MKIIQIPFLPEFEGDLVTGRKTATSRSKRYGKEGDTFEAFGRVFVITAVTHPPLWAVARWFYKEEGFATQAEFIECWDRIHLRKKYEDDPERLVWLHLFERVK